MLGLAVVVTAATDEGGLAAAERVARAVPLVPVCVALSTAVALAGPVRRGEGRALAALGRSPFACAAGAAAGAALVGLAVAGWVLFGGEHAVRAFFPSVHAAGPYRFEDGAFSNLRAGWRVSADGVIALLPPQAPSPSPAQAPLAATGLPPLARASAALLTMIGSLAFALTVAVTFVAHRGRSVVAIVAASAASAVCLQAAAAGRVPAIVAVVPSTALLLGAAWAILRASWQRTTR